MNVSHPIIVFPMSVHTKRAVGMAIQLPAPLRTLDAHLITPRHPFTSLPLDIKHGTRRLKSNLPGVLRVVVFFLLLLGDTHAAPWLVSGVRPTGF